MTKTLNFIKASLIVSAMSILPCNNSVQGQPPSPPAGLTSSNQASSPAEQAPSAPIGSGLIVLITLGVLYSGKKVMDSDSKKLD